jgi:hypothetical protein
VAQLFARRVQPSLVGHQRADGAAAGARGCAVETPDADDVLLQSGADLELVRLQCAYESA